ncbi:MAG: hypothetical protein ABSG65_31010 [Bryobacteraceae bacterium]|jgi:hypothetical protein
MKRAGNLWPHVTSWENLLASALAAARGKRKRPDVARFLFDLEPNLCTLQRELLTMKSVADAPGRSRHQCAHFQPCAQGAGRPAG